MNQKDRDALFARLEKAHKKPVKVSIALPGGETIDATMKVKDAGLTRADRVAFTCDFSDVRYTGSSLDD